MAPAGDHQNLIGRTAVITGAGSGIGRALAQRLAGQGCPLAICDSDAGALDQTASMIAGPVLARELDVRDRHGQMAFAAHVREWAPAPLGAVVNNAGVTVSQPAASAAPEDDEWVLDVNFWGVVNGTRAFLPILLEQDSGAIVNVSSVFGLIGWPTQSAYCASKFAVRGYTESLRHELRDTGVRAITVMPGGVATRIVANSRFYSDDLGRTDKSELEREFANLARTSPERAATTIQKGIEAGRDRILIGPDARALALLLRALPVRYFDVIKRLEPVIRR
jgi:NAD(P)-dependent dehydrogenase (short-subunit alcohol dehydrogenase family)